jgi:hypothetical protein
VIASEALHIPGVHWLSDKRSIAEGIGRRSRGVVLTGLLLAGVIAGFSIPVPSALTQVVTDGTTVPDPGPIPTVPDPGPIPTVPDPAPPPPPTPQATSNPPPPPSPPPPASPPAPASPPVDGATWDDDDDRPRASTADLASPSPARAERSGSEKPRRPKERPAKRAAKKEKPAPAAAPVAPDPIGRLATSVLSSVSAPLVVESANEGGYGLPPPRVLLALAALTTLLFASLAIALRD